MRVFCIVMINKTILISIMGFFLVVSMSFVSAESDACKADVNGDNIVNTGDLIFIRNRLNQNVSVGDNVRADINQDRKINILDLILVRNNIGDACDLNINCEIRDDIEYCMQTDKKVYRLGETVKMRYKATNRRDKDIDFQFVDQMQYSFKILNGGTIIWYRPKAGLPALSGFVLGPNSDKEYMLTWNMISDTGVLVKTGDYEIIGSLHPMLLAYGYEDRYVPVSVLIQIIQ